MGGFPGVGDEFGPYSIVRQIGRGGMGVVFEARDGRLGRSVALKVLSPFLSEDDAFRARFTHEAGVLARLDSSHVVQIHEYGEIDGCLYLTAQLVPGGDLEQHLLSEGALDPVAALELVEQVCEALVDAHEVGVVHRDIKPSNILLRRRGTRLHAFLCDFGIATTADSQHTRTGQVVGSPVYMAPERHRGGRADIRGDIYAVGCVLWRMLTGRHPYPGNDVQVGMAHLQDPIPQLPGTDAVSREVNAVLTRALAKEPDDRYQNPAALRAAVVETLTLARAIAGPAVVEQATARGGRARRARSAARAEPTVAVQLREGPGGSGPVAPLPAADPAGGVTEDRRVPPQREPVGDESEERVPPSSPTVVAPAHGLPAAGRGRRTRVLVAGAVALALVAGGGAFVLSRRGGEPVAGTAKHGGPTPSPGVPTLVRPSDERGGTVRMALGWSLQDGTPDPGGLYASNEWNLSRLYARTLMMVDPAPSAPGHELVPDLATEPGSTSDHGLTWTYTLRPGLTYEDGTPITAKDIRHAVLRSADTDNFSNAPTYFRTLLERPMKSAITTRGTREITFHLKKPFADFDYVAQLPQTAPVPVHANAGYSLRPTSSGPYRFEKPYDPDVGFTLVRNPHWSPSVDPHRSALPDRYVIDTRKDSSGGQDAVLAGTADLSLDENGLTAASADRVRKSGGVIGVSSSELEYATINPAVSPLNRLSCRRAAAYAINHDTLRDAYAADGQRVHQAATMLPPGISGGSPADPLQTKAHPTGNLEEASRALAACGHPKGFQFRIAYGYDADHPTDEAAARAIQSALARVGIDTSLLPVMLEDGDEVETDKCNNPSWLQHNKVGMCLFAWQPDWQDGYGFLDPLADSSARKANGTSYNFSVDSREVDRLIDSALASPDSSERASLWSKVDLLVVKQALFVPGVYVDRLMVQPPGLTNLWVNPTYGAYDYAAVGVVGGGKS